MQVVYDLIAFLGGLSMFLYGMKLMGDGLKQTSGSALKKTLSKVTDKPILGFVFGMMITCLIQSSTATIVLTVGLVGAGFISFEQSIGIVLGANVGTAITAQIIRLMDIESGSDSIIYFFKADNLAPLALIIGCLFIMIPKLSEKKNVANISSGFGILFMGLISMSDSVSSFQDSFSNILFSFSNSYILQFFSGTIVTGVIQSSSAVVGILQSVASSIGVTFNSIFAVIIGVNIGDCLTTYVVSRIGAKPEQKRTALVHVIYNVFAAILLSIGVLILKKVGVLDSIWERVLNSGGVANVHGLFRLIPAIVLLPFTKVFSHIAYRIAPDFPIEEEDAEIEKDLNQLDARLISSPQIALDQSLHLIKHMSDVALHNYEACVDQMYRFEENRNKRMFERENILDRIADATNSYIVKVSSYISNEKENETQNFQLKSLIAFERIGDLSINIRDSVNELRKSKKSFSDNAMAELEIVTNAVHEILENTVISFKNNDFEIAKKIEPLEEVIDELIEDLNNRHVYRMTNNLCDGLIGIQFQNILTNLEHLSDKCSDLAIYIIEQNDSSIIGNEHKYIRELHHSDNIEYHTFFNQFYKKYVGSLNSIPKTGEIK